jgi:hypothetical protein
MSPGHRKNLPAAKAATGSENEIILNKPRLKKAAAF